MKITFIHPNLTDTRSADAWQPLVFAILASLTPPGHELAFFDERLEPIPEDHDTDLVAMTVGTYTARRAYQIATHFRHRGIPVVMGGYHPTFLPDEALNFSDAVVLGDAEGIWEQVVNDAEKGKLERVYRQSQLPTLNGLKFDRTIFEGKRYKQIVPVQYGRGCRYTCDFCSIHAFYGPHTRQRPVAEVLAEIKALGRKFIVFIDDNLFVDTAKAEELFQALIPLDIHWACQIGLDITEHDHLMDLMAKSGCFCAMVGVESLHKANLRQMGKGWNLRKSDYATSFRKLRERGIMVYASLIFGYDHDTADTFDATVEFMIRAKCAMALVNTFAPLPGSRFYTQLMKDNRLIHQRWWLDPNYRYGQATFHPLEMSADQLTEGCMRARKSFHGYGSILKRALDPLANSRTPYQMGLYLAMNLIARRALASKIERGLGADYPLEPPLQDVPLPFASSTGPRLGTAIGG